MSNYPDGFTQADHDRAFDPEISPETHEAVEDALDTAARSQRVFWRDLASLEALLGVDVDGTRDLEQVTTDNLLEAD